MDFDGLLAFHDAHGKLATMTVVRPELQFGVTELDAGRARAGLSREAALRALDQRRLLLLRAGRAAITWTQAACSSVEPLERLAQGDELRAHRHEGFWECMDTYKDAVALNDLWASGEPPWRVPLRRQASGATRRIPRG